MITHLNADQTRSVLAHWLPAELERALYAKADEIAWTPASAPRGKWEVPASPFFQGSP